MTTNFPITGSRTIKSWVSFSHSYYMSYSFCKSETDNQRGPAHLLLAPESGANELSVGYLATVILHQCGRHKHLVVSTIVFPGHLKDLSGRFYSLCSSSKLHVLYKCLVRSNVFKNIYNYKKYLMINCIFNWYWLLENYLKYRIEGAVGYYTSYIKMQLDFHKVHLPKLDWCLEQSTVSCIYHGLSHTSFYSVNIIELAWMSDSFTGKCHTSNTDTAEIFVEDLIRYFWWQL